jgi:hypothetical protein
MKRNKEDEFVVVGMEKQTTAWLNEYGRSAPAKPNSRGRKAKRS